MGTVGVQVGKNGVGGLLTSTGAEDCVHNAQNDQLQEEALALDGTHLAKLFKRRRRATAVLAGDPESALPPKCCDRCKSDLNGKLMVQCATCAFRCHLYCFSPPLKQHPAFLMRRQQQTSQSDQDSSPPVWKCEKCAGTVVVFNVPRPSSSSTKPSMKTKSERSTNKRKSDSIVVATATSVPEVLSCTGEQNDAGSGWIQSVQPQWRENSAVVFDWYHFRSEKAEVLRSLESNTNSRRNGVGELVFYSKSYALMKKAAASWREYALKRKRFRRQQDVETKAMLYPSVKCDMMHIQIPTDKCTVIVESEDNWDGIEDEDVDLVDVTRHKTYSRRPPQLPLLWEGEPPSALMCWTTGERKEVSDVLDEMTEGVCMMNEDNTAPSPRQEVIKTFLTFNVITEIEQTVANFDEEIQDNGHTTFGTYAAAVIVQIIFARHRLRRRRVDRAIRQRRAFEEATRRAKAHSSVALLRICIQFIVLLMKILGQSRTKKALLLVLRDAAEETRVKNSSPLTAEISSEIGDNLKRERVQQLAEMRIRRFFVRRVHPYVKLKKTVMSLRLQHWWRRLSNLRKWREAAVDVRVVQLARQVQASTRIQQFYRRLLTRRRFTELIRKHALIKVRRILISWLLSRLAKKEAKRRAAYEAAQLVSTAEEVLPESARLDEILEKQGLELYQRGDFWNSASILERLCDLRNGKLTQDLQQVLAYSHHMTWYLSYDQFNLTRAHELYCAVLENTSTGERIDPLILQDLAIVSMHKEYFGDSLRLLAKLIEYFARQPQFLLWLLLSAVQLQQQGEWEQSVKYLMYLHDIPPPPYLERDMLALCAMGYEQLAITATKAPETRTVKASLAKEAWSAALRQWNLEKISSPRPGSASIAPGRERGRALTSRQKWELLTDLGQRAMEQGHYLVACRVYIYALEREGTKLDGDVETRTVAWWNLADAFRHLGHLDLYLNAAQRSQSNSQAADEELHKSWQELADQQACSFQTELKTLTVLEKLRQLSGAYST